MLAHVHRLAVLVLLAFIAALLLSGIWLRSAGPVRAGETPTPEPTIVAEITSKRTADSSTYLLSNGAYRARLYSADRYYRSDEDAWVAIDPTLVRAPEGGAAVTAAAPVVVTVAAQPRTRRRSR